MIYDSKKSKYKGMAKINNIRNQAEKNIENASIKTIPKAQNIKII